MEAGRVKTSETRKKEEEVKFKSLGPTNYDIMASDVIITKASSDVILRNVEVNKLIAGKRYLLQRSFLAKKRFVMSSLSMCGKTFTKIALILAIVISVFGSMFNTKLPERISEIGTSSSLGPSMLRDEFSFLESSVFSILQEFSAPIIGINEGLCSCIDKGRVLNNKEPPIRRMEVLHNTIIREEGAYVYPGYASCELATFAKRTFLAGKRLGTYISPFADFWDSSVYYFDAYTVNLELDDNFKVFFDLVYLYIYIYFIVRGHPVTGRHTQRLFQLIYILWSIFPQT